MAISPVHSPAHARGMSSSTPLVLSSIILVAALGCGRAKTVAPDPPVATASASAAATAGLAPPPAHDGQHDFDFLLGHWTVKLRRLQNPLHGSTQWIEGTGTSYARPLWGGKANVDELEADMPNGHVEGMTVRVYSPETRQWSLYWGNQKNGRLEFPPTIGAFENGKGEFYDTEIYEGRTIVVRYTWSNITATSAYFEQAFSPDGGKTWETNWTTQLTRVD